MHNDKTIIIKGGWLEEGAFRQFCQDGNALQSIYVNIEWYRCIYFEEEIDAVIDDVENASQCSTLEEVEVDCPFAGIQLERIAQACYDLRESGI